MYEILALTTLFLSSYALVRIIGAEGAIETLLIFFCVATAQIVAFGYVLSYVNHLGNVRGWAVLSSLTLVLFSALALIGPKRRQILPGFNPVALTKRIAAVKKWYLEETSGFQRLLLIPMGLVTLSLGTLNLVIILSTAPHNFDSMAYHLARMAYYLQQNNLDYFPANYWAQVAHPKNSTLLLLYSYLVSGRNENMTQMIQFVSYWVSICSVYAIARKIGRNRTEGLFASLVSALLIEWVLESTTTQNDMLIAAYSGAATYFLFAFRDVQHRKYPVLAALSISLALGASAKTLLILPSALILGWYILSAGGKTVKRLSNLAYFGVALILALSLFTLPSGYLENYRTFGSPLGPPELKEHSFIGKPVEYVARNGSKNMLRFSFEFLALDGLPPVNAVRKAQSLLYAIPRGFVEWAGINLEASEDVLAPFHYEKPSIFFSNEDWSSWGVLGFFLVWIAVVLGAIGIIKSSDARILSFAALIFFLAVSFGALYEPHRGRYFTACAVFAVPVAGSFVSIRHRLLRTWVLIVVFMGCISAVSAVLLRPARPPVPIMALSQSFPEIRKFEFLPTSVFDLDRVGQLMTNAWTSYPTIKLFDMAVPKDATVAVFMYGNSYEYPLFGEYLTRKIIPINSFAGDFQSIPPDADYLLYTKGFPLALSTDTNIGSDWYLRRLR